MRFICCPPSPHYSLLENLSKKSGRVKKEEEEEEKMLEEERVTVS